MVHMIGNSFREGFVEILNWGINKNTRRLQDHPSIATLQPVLNVGVEYIFLKD